MINPDRRRSTMLLSASAAIVLSSVAWGQTAPPLSFEVASVKPSAAFAGGPLRVSIQGGPGSNDPGTIVTENMTLRNLIIRSYKVNSYQLVGPDWLANTRFDIVAKVAANTTNDQVMEMWRTLFSQRFHLNLHQETRELPVYALVLGKGGPKFQEAESDLPEPEAPLSKGAAPGGDGPYRVGPEKMLMSELSDMLARNVDRPVIDQTSLTARYLISLAWQRDDLPSPPKSEGSDLPSIFAALQEQLGLKLEARKASVKVLVIDQIERTPEEN